MPKSAKKVKKTCFQTKATVRDEDTLQARADPISIELINTQNTLSRSNNQTTKQLNQHFFRTNVAFLQQRRNQHVVISNESGPHFSRIYWFSVATGACCGRLNTEESQNKTHDDVGLESVSHRLWANPYILILSHLLQKNSVESYKNGPPVTFCSEVDLCWKNSSYAYDMIQ